MNSEQLLQFKEVNGIWRIEERKPVTFMHADNMAFLRRCHDLQMFKYFHIGIVDPPYGLDVTKMNLGATKDTVRTYDRGDWDAEIPTQEYWNLLWYCCRHLIVWGANYFVSNFGLTCHPETGKSMPIDNGRCFITWDKMNDKMSFAAGELALTTFDKNAVIIRKARNSKTDDDGEKRHDTQKPVYLYDYIHLNFVDSDKKKVTRILDTHGGSFNHAIAAKKNNLNLTIMDKNKNYFERGLAHYEKESVKPPLLF